MLDNYPNPPYAAGQKSEVHRLCQALLLSNAHTEITSEQWDLEARAYLLMADLDRSKFPAEASHLGEKFIRRAISVIPRHLKVFTR